MLAAGTLCVYALRALRMPVDVLPDSIIFIAIGVVAAVILEFGWAGKNVERVVESVDESFSEIFFTVLLPPVIFFSGLELNPAQFFKRFGSICVYAFLGTGISAAIIGVRAAGVPLVVQGVCRRRAAAALRPISVRESTPAESLRPRAGGSLCAPLQLLTAAVGAIPGLPHVGFLEALLLGTILSATDTVAVIAVFDKLSVQVRLCACARFAAARAGRTASSTRSLC